MEGLEDTREQVAAIATFMQENLFEADSPEQHNLKIELVILKLQKLAGK